MVKSITGFPRGSDSSDSDASADGEAHARGHRIADVHERALASKAASPFKRRAATAGKRGGGGTGAARRAKSTPAVAHLEVPQDQATVSQNCSKIEPAAGQACCSVALPSGLKDLSSVVIVMDPVWGPRLRRVLDASPCEPVSDHVLLRRAELLAVAVSRTRIKSNRTDVCTVLVDSVCTVCHQCFFAQDETRQQTAELADLLSILNLS